MYISACGRTQEDYQTAKTKHKAAAVHGARTEKTFRRL